jgi:hypothetical protein
MTKSLMTKNDLVAQAHEILSIMKDVMREGEHYGKIPGTQKNTLFQTGAQKLLKTFHLGSDEDVINTDEREFSVSYRVKVRLFNIADGNTVGFGIGECSSLEDKYAYRTAVNDAEFDSYPESRRRIKHFQPYGKAAYTVKQVAVNHKDVANTVLKMAKKRALVDATLTATAAGDVFTQDLEDMEPSTRESILDAEVITAPIHKQNQKSNVSLQEIRDGVGVLSYKTKEGESKKLGTIIKEADGKSLLVVTGNPFTNKTMLEKMGFKNHKPQGTQYWETYMDVTHLVEKSNPLGKPTSSKPTTYEALEDMISKLGLSLDIVTINGNKFAEVVGIDIYEKKDAIRALGFQWSNDDSKSWRFDLGVFEQNQKPANNLSMNVISARAEVFGYKLSPPAVNKRGEQWIQALPMDEHGDSISLIKELGFKFFINKNVYALKVG